MNNQEVMQMPGTDEDQNDAELEIDGWSAFWALLLGVGFVVHMTFHGMGGETTPGLHQRLNFFFVLLGGLAITGIALAGLPRMKKPKPKPPTAQDLVA
jgi:hypothetical protein